MNFFSTDTESADGALSALAAGRMLAPETFDTWLAPATPNTRKVSIRSDVAGVPHIYDAADQEIECAGFTLDYDQETGKCFVSIVFKADVDFHMTADYPA